MQIRAQDDSRRILRITREADKNTINLASSLRGGTIGHIAKSLIPAMDSEETQRCFRIAACFGIVV